MGLSKTRLIIRGSRLRLVLLLTYTLTSSSTIRNQLFRPRNVLLLDPVLFVSTLSDPEYGPSPDLPMRTSEDAPYGPLDLFLYIVCFTDVNVDVLCTCGI